MHNGFRQQTKFLQSPPKANGQAEVCIRLPPRIPNQRNNNKEKEDVEGDFSSAKLYAHKLSKEKRFFFRR